MLSKKPESMNRPQHETAERSSGRGADPLPSRLSWRERGVKPSGLLLSLGIFLFAALASGCASVPSGHVGVKWTATKGTDPVPYGEGLHPVAAWNRMYTYDLRTISKDEVLNVMTVDGLAVKLNATVRYHVIPEEVVALHQHVGTDYYAKLISPALRSESRRVVGRYTPEELYSTRRDTIEREQLSGLLSQTQGKHIMVEAVMIRSVDLPASVRAAIDQKLMAEQEVLKMKSALQIARATADKRRIEAQGVADYNRTVAASLSSPILDFERIQQTGRLATSNNAKTLIIDPGKHSTPVMLGAATTQ